jgi:hypothetical protein
MIDMEKRLKGVTADWKNEAACSWQKSKNHNVLSINLLFLCLEQDTANGIELIFLFSDKIKYK